MENLWKLGGLAVHESTMGDDSESIPARMRMSDLWTSSSMLLSLDALRDFTRISSGSSHFFTHSLRASSVVTVHRFEETINGREYQIEVSEVGIDRWRAQIVRVPGGSSALMPFYGTTPTEAAKQLSAWLVRAHRHA